LSVSVRLPAASEDAAVGGADYGTHGDFPRAAAARASVRASCMGSVVVAVIGGGYLVAWACVVAV